MLKENERLYNNVLVAFDIVLSLFAYLLAYYVRVFVVAKTLIYYEQYVILGILIIPIWFILLKLINLQNGQRVRAYSIILIEYSLVVIIGVSILFMSIFLFKLENISRLAVFLFAFINFIFLFISKVIFYKILKTRILKEKGTKNIILIADETSINFIEKIINGAQWGYKIFSIISDSDKIKEKYSSKYKIDDLNSDIDKIVEDNVIDEIIYCKNKIDTNKIQELIYSCNEIGVTLQLQSDFFSLIASKSHVNYFGETSVMTFKTTPTDYFSLAIKNIFDVVISFFALLCFSPILLIIAVIIKLESKGEVLFSQKRVGLKGRMFTMYKFRTMVADAEKLKENLQNENEVDGPVFKIKNDPRITKFGKFLRKTSLDEFPQFYNVLLGHMSIVGPRPPIKEEVKQYERQQLRRLSMKPGITCIWQVSGRNNISFEDWMKMDLQYIDNWSLKFDMILILKTISTVFKKTGY